MHTRARTHTRAHAHTLSKLSISLGVGAGIFKTEMEADIMTDIAQNLALVLPKVAAMVAGAEGGGDSADVAAEEKAAARHAVELLDAVSRCSCCCAVCVSVSVAVSVSVSVSVSLRYIKPSRWETRHRWQLTRGPRGVAGSSASSSTPNFSPRRKRDTWWRRWTGASGRRQHWRGSLRACAPPTGAPRPGASAARRPCTVVH